MQLLRSLYQTYASTGCEWPMIKFVVEYLESFIPQAEVNIDYMGNLYICRRNSLKEERNIGFPTLCCHLDQVQKIHSEDFEVKERIIENSILGTRHVELFGWSESRKAQEGLGADDKNGIWVCLKSLTKCDHIKVFMAVGEEKGCWGSNRANLEFFEDSLYILEPDCKGGQEIRTFLRGVPVASKKFEEELEAEKFGYTITEGKTSDILPLTLSGVGVSCANIPCGYYNPHKDDEYCNIEELYKCLKFVLHTIKTLQKKFPHVYKTETRLWVENNFQLKYPSNCLQTDEVDSCFLKLKN